MQLTARAVAQLLQASLPEGADPDWLITGVTTDSREVAPGQLFVALKGERFDGADFAAEALQRGAVLAVVSQPRPELGARQLVVKDTLAALGMLGHYWREQIAPCVIAVTGSVGKTTTKDLIASICARGGPTVATVETENNEIGVPKTLLRLQEGDRYCVLEFGMRGRGQIRQLTEIARPDVGVITVIGEAHMGLLGSREAIAEAKAEMLPLLPAEGAAVLNADDFFFPVFREMCACRVISFGMSEEAEVQAEEIIEEGLAGVRGRLRLGEERFVINLPLPGRHNLMNALAAAAAAYACGLGPAEIAEGIARYTGAALRGQIQPGPNGSVIVNDCYNANPTSVAASLEMLSRAQGRKIFVFGDMMELGERAPEAHRAVGAQAAAAGVTLLVAVGELAALAAAAAEEAGIEAVSVDAPEEAVAFLRPRLQAEDIVLVKASRAMALERVVEGLTHVD